MYGNKGLMNNCSNLVFKVLWVLKIKIFLLCQVKPQNQQQSSKYTFMRKFLLFSLLLFCFLSEARAQYNNDLIIEPILKTDTTSLGQKIDFPNVQNDEVTILKITLQSGKTTGWHEHDFPVFAYVLKGTLTVEFENGETRKFAENTSFAEVIDMVHRGINRENTDLVLLAFYLGEKGRALSRKKEQGKAEK